MAVSARRLRTRELLLAALSDADALTRADLSGRTGLSASAVSDGITLLQAEGLIAVERTTRAGRGRHPETLRLRRPDGVVVALDFGHMHVTAAVATTAGEVLAEHSRDLDVDAQPVRALDAAAALTRRALATAKASAGQVVGVAAGLPRPLDRRGQAIEASGWMNLDPAGELSRRLGQRVTIGNDADMGARGERAFGVARGLDDFVYVKASHGIGAGLVLNGQSYRGSVGIAGEIGHTQVPGAVDWCHCGSRGCLEAVVSISTVRRQLAHVRAGADVPPLAELAGNEVAARVITDAGRTLGRVLADLVNCLNPAAVVLGGELGVAGAPLVVGVRESIDRYSEPASARTVDVLTAQLGLRSELFGAIAAAAQQAPKPSTAS